MDAEGVFIAEGLAIDKTWDALKGAWQREHGRAQVLATVRDHFQAHGLASAAEAERAPLSGARILEATAGCRTCALGRALLIVHRFVTRDHELIVQAKALRVASRAWEAFREKFAQVDEAPSYPLLDAFNEVERFLDMYSFPLEKAPKAMAALSGVGAGRKPAALRRQIVVVLDNGGVTLRQMADLVDDGFARRGREKRVRNDLQARRRTQAKQRRAGTRANR